MTSVEPIMVDNNGVNGSRKRKEPSVDSPLIPSSSTVATSPSSSISSYGNSFSPSSSSGQFIPLAPSLPPISPTAATLSVPSSTIGRAQTKVAAVASSVDRPTSASALLSALSAATGNVVPSLHTPHLVSPTHINGVIPMPSSLSSNAPLSIKQSPLAAHLPSSLAAAQQRPATSPTSAAKPKATVAISSSLSGAAQSASAKIAQKGVPLPQQLTVKPKVVPTMTAIRPLSQQPRAPRSIAVEAKVAVVAKPSVVKAAVTKPAVVAITSPSVLSSSSSSSGNNNNNSGNTPVIVAVTTGGQTIYEEDDSDPNRLWCFCRMPHTPGTFMIACDTCLEWYHGECVAVDEDDADAIDIYECPLCAGDEYAYQAAIHRARGKKRQHKGEQQRLRKERQQRRGANSRRIAVISSDEDSDSDSDDSDDDIPLTNLGRTGSAAGAATATTTGVARSGAATISDSVKAARRQQKLKDRFAEERKRILVKQERARIKKAADPSYYDEVRAKVRDSLSVILSNEELAIRIEAQLYKVIGDGGKNYKIRFRDLISNLSDKNNPQLIRRVKSGALTPQVLCGMTAKELASQELDAQRKQQQKDFMKDKVVANVVVPVPVMGKGNRDIEPASVAATANGNDSDDEHDKGENVSAGKKKTKGDGKTTAAAAVGAAAVAATSSLEDILGDMAKKKSVKTAEEEERSRQKEIAEFTERQAAREATSRDTEKKAREAEIARERAEKEERTREKNAARERKKEVRKEREKKKQDRVDQAKAARSRVLDSNNGNDTAATADITSPSAASSASSSVAPTNGDASPLSSPLSPRSPSPVSRVSLKPGSNAVVWQGHIKKVLPNPFSLFARHHGGAPVMGMGKCLPAIVEMAGKIKMVKVTDFVDRLIKTSRKKVLVLRFESSSSPAEFREFCNFFVEDGTRCAVLDYQENHGTLLYVVPPLSVQQVADSGLTDTFMMDNLSCHRPANDALWAIACMTKDAYDIANRHDSGVAAAPSSPPHESLAAVSHYQPQAAAYQPSYPVNDGYGNMHAPTHGAPLHAGYHQAPYVAPHEQGYAQGYGAPAPSWGNVPYLPAPHQLHAAYDPRLQQPQHHHHLPIPPPQPLPPPSDPRLRGIPIPPPQPLPPPSSLMTPVAAPSAAVSSSVLPGMDTHSVSETLSYLESLFVATAGTAPVAPATAVSVDPSSLPSDPRRRT